MQFKITCYLFCIIKESFFMKPAKRILSVGLFVLSAIACSKGQNPAGNNTTGTTISSWVTGIGNLLKKQTDLSFGKTANSNTNIDIDSAQKFQTIDGFGYTLI